MKLYTKIILLTINIIFVCGCSNNERIYLDNEYYKGNDFIKINADKINELQNNKSSYIVNIYNNYCNLLIPCENIFKSFMDKYNISFYSLSYEESKKTFIHDKVKYAPSVIIVSKGKIITYLDPDEKKDFSKYQDEKEFDKWLKKYINVKKS